MSNNFLKSRYSLDVVLLNIGFHFLSSFTSKAVKFEAKMRKSKLYSPYLYSSTEEYSMLVYKIAQGIFDAQLK